VCWRALAENPHMSLPIQAAQPFLPPAPPAAPDAPGPFAFAARDLVEGILAAAGFRDVVVAAFDTDVVLSDAGLDDAVVHAIEAGPLARRWSELSDTVALEARAAVRAALAPHVRPDGRVALPGAAWLASARNQ
jgi:hypothetical protein